MRDGWTSVRWCALIALQWAAHVACSDIEPLDVEIDAGSEPDADAAPEGDAAPVTCTADKVLMPAGAYNASPVDQADACDPGNILVRDDEVAGLDRSDTPNNCAPWGGPDLEDPHACGCVGLDLGGVAVVATLDIRAAAVAEACHTACGSGGCGSGRTFPVYFGQTLDEHRFAGYIDVGSSLGDYTIDIDALARYLVVCRGNWDELLDDIVVDHMVAHCP